MRPGLPIVKRIIEPSRRGEVIAGAGLLLTIAFWFGQDREAKGAAEKAIDMNQTLLTQRNRENDAMRADVNELRRMLFDCRKL